MNGWSQFAAFFTSGGPFMYVILSIAVLCLALAAERMWVIGRVASVNSRKLTRDVLRLAAAGQDAQAIELCRQVKGPVAGVALAVLARGGNEETSLQSAADGAAIVALPPLSRRLPFLNILANSATLLGLLGTIFGLTTAFSAVGAADPALRSSFLAAGISQALNTTALGLIVAVPTLLAHGFLQSRVEVLADEADEMGVRLIQALVARRDGTSHSKAA